MELIFIFLIGITIGSFLNVLIDRLPAGETVLVGRSHCDFCKKTLQWYELIPLFSWIIQKGRCRRCRKTLSVQYPLIEGITGIGFILIFQTFPYSLISLFAYFLIFSSLLVIFVADAKYQIIPDSMVVAGVIGALMGLIGQMGPIGLIGFMHNVWSAVGSAGFFYFLWLLTKGRGMGLGDVKLAFLLGLLLGFPGIVVAIYVAFLTGAMFGIILIMQGKKTLKAKIAFGPFLIVGFVVAVWWTQDILRIWTNMF